MKNIYKIAIASLTAAIMSTSAFAGPNDHKRDHHPQYHKHPAQHIKHAHGQPNIYKAAPQNHRNAPPPMKKWQTQHQLPKMYQNSSYRVSSYQRHNLSKPLPNHQWYKVDGHYLLTDTKTDRIIKIVRS